MPRVGKSMDRKAARRRAEDQHDARKDAAECVAPLSTERKTRTPEWRKRGARLSLLAALRSLDNDDPYIEADALGFALIAVTQLQHIDGAEERLRLVLEKVGDRV